MVHHFQLFFFPICQHPIFSTSFLSAPCILLLYILLLTLPHIFFMLFLIFFIILNYAFPLSPGLSLTLFGGFIWQISLLLSVPKPNLTDCFPLRTAKVAIDLIIWKIVKFDSYIINATNDYNKHK